MNIPAKFTKRVSENIKKYQDIVVNLKKKDANESDTVRVVAGLLECIFGYNRFKEVTSEYGIGATSCDLAVMGPKKKVKYLIEVKAASSALNDKHIRQAIDYGARAGVNWVILTNAEQWFLYKIKFGKPIDKELVFEFNLLTINHKSNKDMELLYVLSKDGDDKSSLDDFYSTKQAKSKFIIGVLLNSADVHILIRKKLKAMFEDIKITDSEISEIITSEILKREIVDSEESKKAQKDIEKIQKKTDKKKKDTKGREGASASKDSLDE